MTDAPILLIDEPAPHVRRLTLNRPEKRNALSNELRAENRFQRSLEASHPCGGVEATVVTPVVIAQPVH